MPFSLELPMNTPDWTDVGSGVRESYAGIGSAVRHTPVHPAYALFGLPSMVTRPVCSPYKMNVVLPPNTAIGVFDLSTGRYPSGIVSRACV